jgi:methionine-rich copper-binding protein CopC
MTKRLLPIALVLLLLPASALAASPRTTLHKAGAALDTGKGVRNGKEVTPLLKQLAVTLPALRGADRTRAARLLARPTPGQGASGELEYEVPEATPWCSDHFCVHYVTTTTDRPSLKDTNANGVPDYVETMGAVFEHVYAVENGDLGWNPPKSDGSRGCENGPAAGCAGKTDVYIKEVGDQGIYGYSAPDPGQSGSKQFAYLVMDNDYNSSQFPQYGGNALPPMEVTAAHEYNHVLQFNYDIDEQTWLFEATATWMEDRVYTDVNDYVQYLSPWAQMTSVPLTYFSFDGNDPLNVKVYGDVVWNRWIESHYGPDVVRDTWGLSLNVTPKSFAPAAFNAALGTKGSSFYDAFARFATDTAEWRASDTPFAEGATFPDVDRQSSSDSSLPITLVANRSSGSGNLDHTAYTLLDIQPTKNAPKATFAVSTPRGTHMAIALVGRIGDEVHGTTHEFLKLLPSGGPGTVTIDNPAQYERLTGVVINADTSATFDSSIDDWTYRRDSQPFSARISTDTTAPYVKHRRPLRNTRSASPNAHVTINFSERIFDLTLKTVKLVDANGHAVKTRLALTTKGKKRRTAAGADTAVLTPAKPLHKHTRYEVRLSSDLRDFGGNALRTSALTWSFVTRR